MHTRILGQGMRVSAIGLGAMGMSQGYGSNPGDRDARIAVLRGAVERGITFFDGCTPRDHDVATPLTDHHTQENAVELQPASPTATATRRNLR